MNKFKTVFICAGMLLTFKSYGQNIPLGTLPMIYNGGFAGEASGGRFNMGVSVYKMGPIKNRIPNDNVYRSYFVSYDQFIKKLSTGVGITVIDNASIFKDDLILKAQRGTFVVASVSPKISFKGKYTLSPFINFIYSDSRFDYLNPNPYLSDSTLQVAHSYLDQQTRYTITERFGFLFNSRKSYFGVSFNTLNKDTHTYTNDVNIYPDHTWDRNSSIIGSIYPADKAPYSYNVSKGSSWLFQAGRTFQKLPESKFSITAQLAWQHIRYTYTPIGAASPGFVWPAKTVALNRIDGNVSFRYSKLIASINNNGLGLGYQHENLKILLSQNLIFFDKEEKEASVSVRYLLKSR